MMMLVSILLQAACSGSSTGTPFLPPPPPPPPVGQPDIDVERIFSGLAFASPVALLQAPGDASRWYVVEQAGVVRVFDNDPNVGPGDVGVYIDIRGRVTFGGERGLLGMAFHPDFAANGQVYLSYTGGAVLTSFVSRFDVDAGTGNLDPASESVVLAVPQESTNHNGGDLAFGPDGFLYIGFGDGGGAGDPNERAQDTNYILGSVVRVDVDGPSPYAIPVTNPFATNTNCVDGTGSMPCPEIYAWGFRNPWRFSFDRQTGDLWLGDVGQGAWEEIDRVDAGMNYGWDEREGAHCYEPASGCSLNNVDPITEYANAGDNIAVTGGYVYRGVTVTDLQGYYVFGDYGSGRIWGVPADSAQGVTPEEFIDTPLSISSFAEDVDGELYALNYSGGGIWKIVAAP
jgi:glucose/arabinose dehydrogenase